MKKNKKPHSSLHHLANFWLNVVENVGIEGIAFIKRKGKKNLYIEMIDMRASVTASGRFAEGADFPGEELEGIFLVGIPFDKMNVKTKLYLKYYEKLYGKRKGSYYAYIVPAMRRASQSLGRALRAKEEKAVLICGDERYREKSFLNLLPEYFQRKAEIVDYAKIHEKVKNVFNQF